MIFYSNAKIKLVICYETLFLKMTSINITAKTNQKSYGVSADVIKCRPQNSSSIHKEATPLFERESLILSYATFLFTDSGITEFEIRLPACRRLLFPLLRGQEICLVLIHPLPSKC